MPKPAQARLRALTLVPVLALVVLGAVESGPAQAASAAGARTAVAGSSNAINTASEAAVRAAYDSLWKPAAAVTVAPSGGSTSSCTTFTTSAAQQSATANAINFARGLSGENGVSLTAGYNQAAASSALISAANGALSHDPPSSWRCWSQAGHDASARSDVLLNSGATSAARIAELYLDEPGASNTAVGHRRWLLRPEATTMGSGNAQGSGWFANSLYVFTFGDDNANAAAKPFYSWPSAGYFPTQLEPSGRWSVSSSDGGSFASASVSVTDPSGRAVAVTRYAPVDGYADSTLAWDMPAPATVSSSVAQTYTVTVSGITGGSASAYTYYVRLFDPTATALASEPGSASVEEPLTARPVAAGPVRTATSLGVSKRRTTRKKRVLVTMRATAANGTFPTGTLVLYVGKRKVGSYVVGPNTGSTQQVRLKFGSRGRRAVMAKFRATGSYLDSVSNRAAVRVR